MAKRVQKSLIPVLLLSFFVFSAQKDTFKKHPLEIEVRNYINEYGILELMDEIYNLVGLKKIAEINKKNHDLAVALGLGKQSRLPVSISKEKIFEDISDSNRVENRRILADYFAKPENNNVLTDAERIFLEWHFRIPINYVYNLRKDSNTIVLGWNQHVEIKENSDFLVYTFGLCGCTAVIALSSDSLCHFSHFDNVVNENQVRFLDSFLKQNNSTKVVFYIIGFYATNFAEYLASKYENIDIYFHTKQEFLSTAYSIRVSRLNGIFSISHSIRPVAGDYFAAIPKGGVSGLAQFSQIFPSRIYEFTKTKFTAYRNK